MGSAGRPQGRLKGETEQADALARFVREVTSGVTLRRLAQRYPAGRTSWSAYRSAEKDIPWHLLQRLVHDQVEDPRARAALLARAAQLHEQATRAAEGIQPPAARRSAAQQALDRARDAQRQAEEGMAEAEDLIRVLVAIVAELRSELAGGADGVEGVEGVGGTGGTDDPEGATTDPVAAPLRQVRQVRLREATWCLAEVRRIRESAREARHTAGREQEAVGLLVDQERSRVGAEPASNGVDAHLPVLRRLEADLVGVREALAGQYREVSGMALVPAGPRIVRGELVRVVDHGRSGPTGPTREVAVGATVLGPPRGGPTGARWRRKAGAGVVVGATGAVLAGILVLAGVLVGVRLGAAAHGPFDAVPQAAGAWGRPGSGAPSPAAGSPSAPAPGPVSSTLSAPATPSSAPDRSGGTPTAPPVPLPSAPVAPEPGGTAARSTGAGQPPDPAVPAVPSAEATPAGTPSAPASSTPTAEVPAPGRLGGAPVVPPTGSVEIRNGNSQQCIATPGGTREDGREVQQYPCGDFPDHFWEAQKAYTDPDGDTYYRIVSYNSALCLSVRDSSTRATAEVVQSECRSSPGQSWKIEKWPRGMRFVNDNSHQCLAVTYRSTAPQAPLMQYPCGDYPDHYWDYGPRR